MIDNFGGVGARIDARLKELKIKQADLCRETGISNNAISQYVTGKRIPDTNSLYKLSVALDITMEWLLTGEYPTNENTTNERTTCNGVPLDDSENELLSMYRQLPQEHKKEVFNLTFFKYKWIVEQGNEFTYSRYTGTSAIQESLPDDDDMSGIA